MKKSTFFAFTLSTALIGATVGTFYYLFAQEAHRIWADNKVDQFMKTIDYDQSALSTLPPEYTVNLTQGEELSTVGVLQIPALSRQIPVVNGSVYSEHTGQLLKSYAVLYSDFGDVGFVHNNAVVTSIAGDNLSECNACYFEDLNTLQMGDELIFIDSQGTTYFYEIFMINNELLSEENWFYEQPVVQNESWLTLIAQSADDNCFPTLIRASCTRTLTLKQ